MKQKYFIIFNFLSGRWKLPKLKLNCLWLLLLLLIYNYITFVLCCRMLQSWRHLRHF